MRSLQIVVLHMSIIPLAQLVLWLQANPSTLGPLSHPEIEEKIPHKDWFHYLNIYQNPKMNVFQLI